MLRHLPFVAASLLSLGCVRHYPELANRPLYTCCNLHFNREGDASDANYEYVGGITIPPGTRVTVISDHRNAIDFRAAIPSQQVFTLAFRFGRPAIRAAQYFGLVLVPDDPTPRLRSLEPSVAAAVREGRVVVGMTKDEVLLARGYPPFHRTPAVAANRWIYYEFYSVVDLVDFVDGRVSAVTRAPAPQQ